MKPVTMKCPVCSQVRQVGWYISATYEMREEQMFTGPCQEHIEEWQRLVRQQQANRGGLPVNNNV
jgi:hypothetical protein